MINGRLKPRVSLKLERGSDQKTKSKQLQTSLERFSESLNEVIKEITTLEVNTIIVSEITGKKFLPEETYQNIFFCLTNNYKIPHVSYEKLKAEIAKLKEIDDLTDEERIPPRFIDSSCCEEANYPEDRIIAEQNWLLREKLTREYLQIFFKEIYDEQDKLPANLPFPYVTKNRLGLNDLRFSDQLLRILDNSRFVSSLRKAGELRAAVNSNDEIVAQTVMQWDGDIINRYRSDLFKNEYKDIIIQIHNQSVSSGEQQWHGLIEFTVDLMKRIMGVI